MNSNESRVLNIVVSATVSHSKADIRSIVFFLLDVAEGKLSRDGLKEWPASQPR